jgi:hypothetical protein
VRCLVGAEVEGLVWVEAATAIHRRDHPAVALLAGNLVIAEWHILDSKVPLPSVVARRAFLKRRQGVPCRIVFTLPRTPPHRRSAPGPPSSSDTSEYPEHEEDEDRTPQPHAREHIRSREESRDRRVTKVAHGFARYTSNMRNMRVAVALVFATGCGLSVVGSAGLEGDDASVTPVVADASTAVEAKEAGATSTHDGAVAVEAGSCACDAWAACEGTTCVDVASALKGIRHEIPCTDTNRPACGIATASPPDKTLTLKGSQGKTYDVVVRLRGVLEQRTYNGDSPGPATGQNQNFFTFGGTDNGTSDTWNIYDLRVSSPNWTWHLNSGTSGNKYSDPIDYKATIRAGAGATITIHADSIDLAQANNQDKNNTPIVVSSLSPTPFPGQFVQLDPVSVTVVP